MNMISFEKQLHTLKQISVVLTRALDKREYFVIIRDNFVNSA